MKMIGPDAQFFHQGEYHSTLKKLVRASFLPSALARYILEIEKIVLRFLTMWVNDSTIHTLHEMKMYAFDVAMNSAFGDIEEQEIEGIKCLYQRLEKGYNSMPLDFPGTPYHKAMKARKKLNDRLKKLIEKKRKKEENGGGLLGVMLKAQVEKVTNGLSGIQIAIGVIFAAHDTTASVLTWAIKYLHDNPNILEDVTRELDGIRRKLQLEDKRGLKWEDTRQMLVTSRALLKPNTFMQFGRGMHSCPGSDLAKLEILIILHHLTTTFRWKVLGAKDAVQYGPFPVPKGGLPIQVYRRENTE